MWLRPDLVQCKFVVASDNQPAPAGIRLSLVSWRRKTLSNHLGYGMWCDNNMFIASYFAIQQWIYRWCQWSGSLVWGRYWIEISSSDETQNDFDEVLISHLTISWLLVALKAPLVGVRQFGLDNAVNAPLLDLDIWSFWSDRCRLAALLALIDTLSETAILNCQLGSNISLNSVLHLSQGSREHLSACHSLGNIVAHNTVALFISPSQNVVVQCWWAMEFWQHNK